MDYEPKFSNIYVSLQARTKASKKKDYPFDLTVRQTIHERQDFLGCIRTVNRSSKN